MGKRLFQGTLETFLAELTSRRTEHRGYWLFGFLFDAAASELHIDLMVAAPLTGAHPTEAAKRYAEHLFFRRLSAENMDPHKVTSATLRITMQGDPVDQVVGGVRRTGREMLFRIASGYEGTLYHAECARFVAPHDPALEQVSQPPFDEGEGRDT